MGQPFRTIITQSWGRALDLTPLLVVAGFYEVEPDVSPWPAHLVVVVGSKVVSFTVY